MSMIRAVQYDRYGSPDELTIREVPVPPIWPGSVLVKVRALSINPVDAVVRRGDMRLMSGRKFPKGTGLDFTGEVAELGASVTDLDIGQAVWGGLGGLVGATGAAADYVVARRSWLSAAPKDVPLLEAAALPMTGLTALQLIRDMLRVMERQRLLVIGASGGVGSAALQIAVSRGAEVTALSSAPNMEFCRSLGAREVFDYAVAPGGIEPGFDAILDCHGVGLIAYRRLLTRRGRMATVSMRGIKDALVSMVLPGPSIGVHMTRPNSADLAALARLVDEKQIRPQIERIYPLAAIAAAHRDAESGHARGKKVVDVLG